MLVILIQQWFCLIENLSPLKMYSKSGSFISPKSSIPSPLRNIPSCLWPCPALQFCAGLRWFEGTCAEQEQWGSGMFCPVAAAWTQASHSPLWASLTSSVHTDSNAHLRLMEGSHEIMHSCESISSWNGNNSDVSSLWGLSLRNGVGGATGNSRCSWRQWGRFFRIFSDFLCLTWSRPSHPHQKGLCLLRFLRDVNSRPDLPESLLSWGKLLIPYPRSAQIQARHREQESFPSTHVYGLAEEGNIFYYIKTL